MKKIAFYLILGYLIYKYAPVFWESLPYFPKRYFELGVKDIVTFLTEGNRLVIGLLFGFIIGWTQRHTFLELEEEDDGLNWWVVISSTLTLGVIGLVIIISKYLHKKIGV